MTIATEAIRLKAIAAYKSGCFTQKQLALAYGVHYKTIQNWIKLYNTEGIQAPRKRGCRPRVFTASDDLVILKLIEDNPSITLDEIRIALNKSCNTSVVHKTLIRLGFIYKKNAESVRTRPRRCEKSS